MTFCGSLVLSKLIPYFSGAIKYTISVIYFDTFLVPDMQFLIQFVLLIGMWVITKSFHMTFCGSLVLSKLIPYFSGTIKYTIFMIYFDRLWVLHIQFPIQFVLLTWMWVITKSFQMTFCGSLVLFKLTQYLCGTIKYTICVIYFDTFLVPDMQFLIQFVLLIWMWVITKSFHMTYCGSLVLSKLIPYFSGTIKHTIFMIYFDRLWVLHMQFLIQFVLLT